MVKLPVFITKINTENVTFSNGMRLYYDHCQDCCEHNYADWSYLEDEKGKPFYLPLEFESCDGGFRFGNGINKVFVPCYSEQNGYYTTAIDIYLYRNEKSKLVLESECEMIGEIW